MFRRYPTDYIDPKHIGKIKSFYQETSSDWTRNLSKEFGSNSSGIHPIIIGKNIQNDFELYVPIHKKLKYYNFHISIIANKKIDRRPSVEVYVISSLRKYMSESNKIPKKRKDIESALLFEKVGYKRDSNCISDSLSVILKESKRIIEYCDDVSNISLVTNAHQTQNSNIYSIISDNSSNNF